jgi:thiol-disulfide isomerase/thioredoxin
VRQGGSGSASSSATRARGWLAAVVVAALALAAGLHFGQRRVDGDEAQARAALARATWTDDRGRTISPESLRGKVVVLNFWATWCAPCREEMPAFVRARRALENEPVEILGLAIDSPAPVSAFAKELGVTYPIVVLGADGIELMRALGNRPGGLPFTVVLDRAGEVRARHLGTLDQATIERLVREALGTG